ncbi:MAG: hypothetical protein AAFZ87_14945 [Planctomycetota bacterium]
MRTVALTCNRCGAPIQAPDSLRFVTCSHCNTRLKIQTSGGATYTELLEDMRETQVEMAADLDTIQLQNELDRVDREWADEQRGFETVDKRGRRRLPSDEPGTVGILFGLVMAFFMVGMLATALSNDAPSIFPIFIIGMLVVLGINVLKGFHDSEKYADARKAHERRRGRILSELREKGALKGDE